MTRTFPPARDGVAHHVDQLSRRQRARGCRVRVVQPAMPRSERDGVEVLAMPGGAAVRHTLTFAALAAVAVNRAHAQAPLDVLHVHGDAVEAFVLAVVARRLRRPVVLTLHARLSRAARYRRWAGRLLRRVDRLVAVSDAVRADALALGVASSRVDVVSTGVDRAVFAPASPAERAEVRRRLSLPADATVVVAAGRLHPLKGFTRLAAAAARLAPPVEVYVLGDGPERAALEALVAAGGRMHLVGEVPHADVAGWLRGADVFVLSSVELVGQGEGAPTVVLEAMASGLPVVATDVGGVRDLVAHGETGLVVAPNDPAALAAAITTLAGDPAMRRRMGAAARGRSAAHDWEVVTRRIAGVYAAARAARG